MKLQIKSKNFSKICRNSKNNAYPISSLCLYKNVKFYQYLGIYYENYLGI